MNRIVKKVSDMIADLPGQLFFGFAEASAPAPAPTAKVVSAALAVDKGEGLTTKPARPETIHPVNIEGGMIPSGSFVTESRACDLFMKVAARLRPGQVKKARVVFKPFRSTLYSFKIGKNGLALVKFHQAFRQASEAVLQQAMDLMLARRKSEKRLVPREAYDAFVRDMSKGDFNLPGARKPRRVALAVPGRYRSLDDSFERINTTYFSGRLAKPELCWSPVRARRVLGSYQERYDRLIISQVFDSPKVPEFVLDFLMFHELLHKFLGIGRREDGKRCMHGPEFRSLEKQFKQFDQAQAFLKKL